MVIANMGFTMLATIITPYVVSMGYTLAIAGVITGIMSIVAMVSRPFTGIVGGMFNKKYLLLIFTGVSALAIAGYAVTTSVPVLIAIRVFHGIAFSITTTITMAVAGEYIPMSRLGEGMGYFGVAQAVATAIGPNLGLTIAAHSSYKSAIIVAVMFTIAGTVAVLVLDSPREKNNKKKLDFDFIKKNFIAKEALPFTLICFCIGSFYSLENSFLALYSSQIGLKNVGWYFTVSAIVLMASKLLLGRAADKYSFKKILILGSALEIIALFMLGTLKTEIAVPMLIATAVIRSTGIGLLQPAVQAECFKSVSEDRRSAASSTYFLEMDLGVGSAPILGATLQRSFNYGGMYLAYIVPLLASVLIFIGLGKKKKKEAEVETSY